MPLTVLSVSPEVAGYAKSGGVADVAAALPKALKASGLDVRIVMPDHAQFIEDRHNFRPVAEDMTVEFGDASATATVYIDERLGLKAYLINQPDFFGRDGIYAPGYGRFDDNPARFAFFCHAVFELCQELDITPDVIHCHDWTTGLIPALLKTVYQHTRFKNTKTLFTLHNIGKAHQGWFGRDAFNVTGLPESTYSIDGIEFYGGINYMKAGIVYADAISTVSPTYAKEIVTPEQGQGLDGVIAARAEDLHGILNGIDTSLWDPSTDNDIAGPFSAADTGGKARCKTELLGELGLDVNPDRPVAGMVTRIVEQKGLKLVIDAWDELLKMDVCLVILGTGMNDLEEALAARAAGFPRRAAFINRFDNSLARRIYAGSDVFPMPSQFEPCGLAQMIAMRYGAVPMVRAVGGLKDTVTESGKKNRGGNGFTFDDFDVASFLAAFTRARALYDDAPQWHHVRQKGMTGDYSWDGPAKKYVELYNSL